jgi:SAM-dependent MidA family methyltransferase
MGVMSWRAAMASALYGPDGFFVRTPDGPAGHFRTSVHASPLFAGALLRLIERVDAALGRPDPFDVVDVGAGRGELLTTLDALVGDGPAASGKQALRERIRFTAVEVAPQPRGLADPIGWQATVPDPIVGVLVATEWLDNVPLDVAEMDDDGQVRLVLVDPATGVETIGGLVPATDAFWLARWWPGLAPPGLAPPGLAPRRTDPPGVDPRGLVSPGMDPPGPAEPGQRAEIGWPRDVAWADAVSSVRRGCALAVDYGHVRERRPVHGTLTGFRGGRQVRPIPDGSCDITAHVAMDGVAAAAGTPYRLVTQRHALRALGVDGSRPPLALARTDPAGYLRALAGAGAAAEPIDPAGLGGHWWLLHTIGIPAAETLLA